MSPRRKFDPRPGRASSTGPNSVGRKPLTRMLAPLSWLAYQVEPPRTRAGQQHASLTYIPDESARDEVESSTGAEPTERGSDGPHQE